MARQLYGIQGKVPLETRPARMLTIAGDHGVVEEGVAASPKEVTVLMVLNFLRGGAGVNCLCEAAGADIRVVDAGVDAEPFPRRPPMLPPPGWPLPCGVIAFSAAARPRRGTIKCWKRLAKSPCLIWASTSATAPARPSALPCLMRWLVFTMIWRPLRAPGVL